MFLTFSADGDDDDDEVVLMIKELLDTRIRLVYTAFANMHLLRL